MQWDTAMLLVLGITERCNLCCSYCCYSGEFAGQRTHSSKTMSWEIAERAIRYYLENDQAGDGSCPISIYGGEPLLEMDLLKHCVSFAETLVDSLGKKIHFAITTNGTLLDDETVDYLVEHDFLVLVSLDGPKESHDRYRIYPNGKGSFETVTGNLHRFVERYPDYCQRGLSVTLAPPIDLEVTGRFIADLYPHFPVSRVGLVNPGNEYRFMDDSENATRYGCFTPDCCKSPVDPEGFRAIETEDKHGLTDLWNRTIDSIVEQGTTKTWDEMPFAMLLFEPQIGMYHRRGTMDQPPDWTIYVPCLPGFTRRFCDAEGNYRVCERVDHSDAYILGNVWDGPDPKKMWHTMELRRHLGDCGNCASNKTCDMCYARIPMADHAKSGYDPMFDRQCQATREATTRMLRVYTSIMERNPDAFQGPAYEHNPYFKKIRYAIAETAPTEPVHEMPVDILTR